MIGSTTRKRKGVDLPLYPSEGHPGPGFATSSLISALASMQLVGMPPLQVGGHGYRVRLQVTADDLSRKAAGT